MSGDDREASSELRRMSEHEPLLGFEGRGLSPVGGKKAKCLKCLPCCICGFLIIFVISIIIAVGLSVALAYHEVDAEFENLVADQVQLTKGSAAEKQFTTPGAPIYMKFYMFTLTNKDDFINNGAVPQFKEVGPFVYKENKTKYNVVWNEDETIMRFDQETTYTYDHTYPNNTNPNTTTITTINLPLLGILQQLGNLKNNAILKELPDFIVNYILKLIDDELLERAFKEDLFMTRPVHEVIWGYSDNLLKFVYDSPLKNLLPNGTIPKDGIFALEEMQTKTGPHMIHTGKGAPKLTASYIMWNGKTSIDQWGTPYARMVNGTEALMFHPGVTKYDKLDLFVSELFRSGYFTFYKNVTEYGIKTLQFRLPDEELDGRTQDTGFYMKSPKGMLNLSAVYPLNAPVYVSKPHYLDCDEQYTKNVSVSKADKDIHDAFLNVEPITGAVLHAAKRLQINVKLDKDSSVPQLAHIPDVTYIPVLWVDEGGKLNSTLATEFKKRIYLPRDAVHYGSISLTGFIGAVALISLCVVIVLCAVKCRVDSKRRRQYIN